MSGINKATILGNVGSVDIRSTQTGACIASISIATSDKYKDKQGNTIEDTQWHNVTLFNRQAEIVRDYVKKGDKLYVEGKIKTEKYTDKQGVEKSVTKILAKEIHLLGMPNSSKDNSQGEQSRQPNDSRNYRQQQTPPPPLDDDIPF